MEDKVRVFEIAEEVGATSTEVINKAAELNIKLKSPQSAASFEQAEAIAEYIMTGKSSLLSEKQKKKISNSRISNLAKALNIKTPEFRNKVKDLEIDIDNISKKDEDEIKKYINTGKSKLLKINVSEFAKIKGVTFDELIKKASEIGISIQDKYSLISYAKLEKVNNHMSSNNTKKEKSTKDGTSANKKLFSSKVISYDFPYKNILLKGVPGTGKSRTIDNIIKNKLNIKDEKNILKINIHSSSSNADLMQGIGINSKDGNIEYKEKQGLILDFIQTATFNPNQAFALVLEEIQENSLNELIGDLIYLIEDDKRVKNIKADNRRYTYEELLKKIINQDSHLIKIPNLVSEEKEYKNMILPDNLFIFCTSNYRDDKKIIEDNLLRRFDVIELYPKYKEKLPKDVFKNTKVSNFLRDLNKSIIEVFKDNGEVHPDRFMIGHSIWLNVDNKIDFKRAFLKVLTEFKDVKDIHFDEFLQITEKVTFPFEIENSYESYQEWINSLQNQCYDFL